MRLTTKQIAAALSKHFSAKHNGTVLAYFDEEDNRYSISGSNLPSHPDVRHLYPNGWSLLDYIDVEYALDIAEAYYDWSRPKVIRLAEAVAVLDKIESRLYQQTYASDGVGSMSWAHWYDDVASAIEIIQNANREVREELAWQIGATLNPMSSQNLRRS